MSMDDNITRLLMTGGTIVLVALCCGTCLFDSPGPSSMSNPCMLDEDTIRYEVEIGSAETPMTALQTTDVGETGSIFEEFSAVEPLEDGTYRATFRDTLNDETATMILQPCE